MGGQEDSLTRDEIWDDSALIDSWNDALEEYKKYHSIHATGGRLKDIEESKPSVRPTTNDENDDSPDQDMEEGVSVDLNGSGPTIVTPTQASRSLPPGPPPQMLLGSVRDENLKKLLMSWYYAGYYTGLYEGQQQAQQENKPSS